MGIGEEVFLDMLMSHLLCILRRQGRYAFTPSVTLRLARAFGQLDEDRRLSVKWRSSPQAPQKAELLARLSTELVRHMPDIPDQDFHLLHMRYFMRFCEDKQRRAIVMRLYEGEVGLKPKSAH